MELEDVDKDKVKDKDQAKDKVKDQSASTGMAVGGHYGSTGSVNRMSRAAGSPGFGSGSGRLNPGGAVSGEDLSSTADLLPSMTSTLSGRSTPVMNLGRGGSGEEGYEELLKDSVPCPTCRGLGRVRREQESELVALIPMRDKRLKPRRTWMYVSIAILLCVVVAGTSMFFLFPRDVVITSNRPLLEPIILDLNVSAMFVNFTVMNKYNFTNNNFVPVQIVGSQMTAMYDERVMAKANNQSVIEVPIRSIRQYGIVMNFVLSRDNDWGFLVSFCEDNRPWVHNLPITFELMSNYTYLGHIEQTTLTTYQQVSCYNTSSHTTVSPPPSNLQPPPLQSPLT